MSEQQAAENQATENPAAENQPVNFSNTNHEPATVDRLADILTQIGFKPENAEIVPGKRTLVLPFSNGQIQVDLAEGGFVHARSIYAQPVPADQVPVFYQILNQWNATNIGPTAFVAEADEGEVPIHRAGGRSVGFWPAGPSDFELAIFFQAALTYASGYLATLDTIFSHAGEEAGASGASDAEAQAE